MKKIKGLLIVVAASFATIGCQDAIDIIQDGELVEENVFKTAADLEKYLNGSVYSSLDNQAGMKFSSVFTDEVKIGPSNTGQDASLYRYILNSGSSYVGTIWAQNYSTINTVNRLLKAAQNITPVTAEDQVIYNNAIGEARALRALAYMNLLSYFSPNMSDDSSLGVILSLTVPNPTEMLPRATTGEVWAAVEEDLNFAASNISPTYQAGASINRSSQYFISKIGVDALKARMYTYRKNYAQAKTYAQNVISAYTAGLTAATPLPTGTPGSAAWNSAFYGTTSTNPYRKMWTDTERGEVIFGLSRPAVGQGGIASLWTTNQTNLTGGPLFVTGLNLFNLYTNTPADIRRYAFVDPTFDATERYYVIDKYPGKGSTPLKNDVKIIRLSEVYLILAEAEAKTGNLPGAATAIQTLRNARVMSGTAPLPSYGSVTQALRDILLERRVELAYEGHRYVDLRRLGAEASVSIDRNAQDDIFPSTPLSLDINDHRFTLPIPAVELTGNTNIQQNPGYN